VAAFPKAILEPEHEELLTGEVAVLAFPAFHPGSLNHYVEIRADATVDPDPGYAFADRLGARYATDMRTFDGPTDTRAVVTLHPRKTNIVDVRG
jgi:hypothetical protein